MTGTTRAAFLTRSTKGGLALVAGGSILAAGAAPALARGTADTDIAALAATAELLAMDFYKRAIASKKFKGAELGYMGAALGHEQAHYAALKGVLGAKTPKGITFRYPPNAFGSAKGIGALGQALETAFVGAYMGAVTAFKSNELKGVAALIGSSESRHLAVLSNIAAGSLVADSKPLPKALTAAQATAALKPFLPA
jgi:hypothetical protein